MYFIYRAHTYLRSRRYFYWERLRSASLRRSLKTIDFLIEFRRLESFVSE